MTEEGTRYGRRDVLGGIGAGVAAGAAGCLGGGGGDDGSFDESLQLWLFGGIPAEREYISTHYGEYDGHDVEYTHQEWGQKYQIIASAAANDNLPHVMIGQGQQIPDYVTAGALQPLDEEYPDRVDELNDLYIDANLETLRFGDIGGYDDEMQWAMPGGFADMGPFIDIREDYLEETSFSEPPTNWEELIQLGEEMQDIDDVSAAITTSGTDFGLTTGYFIGLVYANGGRYYDPSSLEATIDEPGFVDAVKLYQDIAEAGLFPDTIAENDHIQAGNLLTEGESGIFITYSHAAAVYETIGVDQAFLDGEGHITTRAPLPDSPSGQFEPQNLLLQNANAQMMGADVDGAERDATFDYIDWWAQEEQLGPWGYDPDVGIRGRIPTLRSSWEDPAPLMESQFGGALDLYEADSLFTETARFPSFSGIAAVQSEINTTVLQPVMLGEATAEEACEEANPAVQQIIENNVG